MADIGLEITTVEKKLDGIFDLASKWEAVLLFDEADVLLETRTDESPLRRNAMVSGTNNEFPIRLLYLMVTSLSFPEGLGVLRWNSSPNHQPYVS